MFNKNYYKFIINENYHRLKVLQNYDKPFLDEYINYEKEFDSFSSKLCKQLSMSTNYIRKHFLNDYNVISASYHLSKSRLDFYNGALSQIKNADRIYSILENVDTENYDLYFITLNYCHASDLTNLNIILHNMKYMYKNYIRTDDYNLIDGMIIKYELCWNLYDNTLVLSPHNHIILKVSKNNTSVIDKFRDHFRLVLDNPDNDLNIKLIQDNNEDRLKVAKYISKDVYSQVFHFNNKNKENKDPYAIPYEKIMYVLLHLNNYQFLNSYKDLQFNIFYRK